MEKYLAGEEITTDEIKAVIRKSTIANTMVPVCCGTSYKNKGVQKLLDAIVDYMPAPTDIPTIKGINPETDEEEERQASATTSRSPRWLSRSRPTPMSASSASSASIPARWTPARSVYNSEQGQHRAHGPHPADARQPPEGS